VQAGAEGLDGATELRSDKWSTVRKDGISP
jgi:hypothetical protein